jgi:hypothetical protein
MRQVFSQGSETDWLNIAALNAQRPEYVAEQILGVNQSGQFGGCRFNRLGAWRAMKNPDGISKRYLRIH